MMHVSIYVLSLSLIIIIPSLTAEFNIDGTTATGWEFVRDSFQENFAQERDLGGSVAIYHQGKLVVDLRGGWFEKTKVKPYATDTLQLVFSTTKGLVAIAVALCVQRGLINYSDYVTKHWPEYGNHGKEDTIVADIMSHRGGLPYDTSPFSSYWNWTGMIQSLEQRQPAWVPRTKHGYHALTYGWLAGELVRRVDPKKRSLGGFIKEEIADPLGIEFYVGLPPELENRVSPVFVRTNENGTVNDSQFDEFNDPRTHQAEIPAANGITNARSLARLYAALLGDVDDNKYKRILTEETLNQATKSNTPLGEIDEVLQIPNQLAMGFYLLDPLWPSLKSTVFGHSGNRTLRI